MAVNPIRAEQLTHQRTIQLAAREELDLLGSGVEPQLRELQQTPEPPFLAGAPFGLKQANEPFVEAELCQGGKGAVFYARYVDDIVVLFAPTRADDKAAYEGQVRDAIVAYGLTPNPDKTFSRNIEPTASIKFDYLGYRFEAAGGRCTVHVSAKKVARYKKRVELCFTEFARRRRLEPKVARILTGSQRICQRRSRA